MASGIPVQAHLAETALAAPITGLRLRIAKVENLPGADHSRTFRSGAAITVFIAHQADDGYLKKGMKIKIFDYTVRGDEGGDWYSFSAIDRLEAAGR
jgi:hypothetical protein